MPDQTLPLCYTFYIWEISFAFNFYATKKGNQDGHFYQIKCLLQNYDMKKIVSFFSPKQSTSNLEPENQTSATWLFTQLTNISFLPPLLPHF